MKKTYLSLLCAGALTLTSGCNYLKDAFKPSKIESQSYFNKIESTILDEGRTETGGYFVLARSSDGNIYKASQYHNDVDTTKAFGMSLDEVDKKFNKGDKVILEVGYIGEKGETPNFKDKNLSLVGIEKIISK